jgi:hypothetical protein
LAENFPEAATIEIEDKGPVASQPGLFFWRKTLRQVSHFESITPRFLFYNQ